MTALIKKDLKFMAKTAEASKLKLKKRNPMYFSSRFEFDSWIHYLLLIFIIAISLFLPILNYPPCLLLLAPPRSEVQISTFHFIC